MVADMAADMEVHMVADMAADKKKFIRCAIAQASLAPTPQSVHPSVSPFVILLGFHSVCVPDPSLGGVKRPNVLKMLALEKLGWPVNLIMIVDYLRILSQNRFCKDLHVLG